MPPSDVIPRHVDAGEFAAYELTLRATSRWFDLGLRDLWRYRDLLMLLVRRDFVSKYKQTILGPLWFILQPLMMAIVFTVIFGRVAGLPTDGLPPLLFYLCGQLAWSYFAQTFTVSSGTLVANAGLFSKVYFPRLIVPLAALVANLFAFAIQAGTFAAFYLYFRIALQIDSFGVSRYVVLLPFVLLHVGALGLGTGLIMAAATAKYRDLTHLTGVLIQVWMYATPVIYPLGKVPAEWQWVMAINPMSVVVESFRLMLLGTGTVVASHLAISLVSSALLLLIGILVFTRVEKTFVDVV